MLGGLALRTPMLSGLLFGLILAANAAPVIAASDPSAELRGLDADVKRAMEHEHVPGAAVGVLVDGKVILAKGYGVRDVRKPALVDADTLFDIGSMTKSFTSTAAAAMVDDGKLEWDTPIIEYLPWFRMYDPIATQLVTMRDLLTHRSGLSGNDFIRVSTYLSREELVRRIRYLEPSHTFRQVYQYNNLMYTVAGYVAGHVNGTTWEELVRQRIFLPLGMTHSNTSAVELVKSEDFAQPHNYVDGKIAPIEPYDYQQFGVGPNGAVNSSVNDMLKYLAFHLADGMADGRQVISQKQMRVLHRPSTVAPSGDPASPGWYLFYKHGHRGLSHGGGVPGFTSDMWIFPEEKLAMVVLNNKGSDLPEMITTDIQARLLHFKRPDLFTEQSASDKTEQDDHAREVAKFIAARTPNTHPSLDLSQYAGTYFHPAYGAIHVVRDGEGLAVHFDAVTLSLKHYQYDTFYYNDTETAQFHIDTAGRVSELLLPLEPAVHPFVFVRRND